VTTTTAAPKRNTPRISGEHRNWILAWALVAPTLILVFAVVAYPTGYAIWMSFHKFIIGQLDRPYVGLANYIKVMGEPFFWESFVRSVKYVSLAVPLKLFFGLVTALVLNERFRGRGWLRALVLVPWALPPLTSVMTWKFIFHDTTNVLSTMLMYLNIIEQPVSFLGLPKYAMNSAILVNVWRGFPFFAITLLAGLAPIPRELYEAAKVDGANAIQRFFAVTLPGLWPVALVSTILSTIWTLNEFPSIYLLTEGGPFRSTMTLALSGYFTAFVHGSKHLSHAVIYSLGLVPLMVGLIAILARAMARREDEGLA